MSPNNNKVLIILPAYNETGKVGRVVEKIKATREAMEEAKAETPGKD